jgi:hypothetical protein
MRMPPTGTLDRRYDAPVLARARGAPSGRTRVWSESVPVRRWTQTVRRLSRCVACSVLIGLMAWAGGRIWAQEPEIAFPDELRIIAAACRENSERIKSLRVSGVLVATGTHYQGWWDPIAGLTYNSQTRTFSLWKDGSNSRFDQTTDHEGEPGGEVAYHMAYGEHIMSSAKLEREGGLSALLAKYGTPQNTKRTIVSADNALQYKPEDNEVKLNEPSLARGVEEERARLWALNKTLLDMTLAEAIDRLVELAPSDHRSIEATPLQGGQYRIHVEVPAPRSPTLDMVIDLDQGGSVLSFTRSKDGQTDATGQFRYMSVGGAWIVAHGENWSILPNGETQQLVYDVNPESVQVNEPIDPQVFTFEGLNVRRGAHVFDHKTHEEYLYDDVPLYVKDALALAREREEELALAESIAGHPLSPPTVAGVPTPQPPPPAPEQGAAPAAAPNDAPSGPSSIAVVSPDVPASKPPSTRPAPAEAGDVRVVTPTPTTRPITTRSVSVVQQPEPNTAKPAEPAAGVGEAKPARGMTTLLVVGAGCAAAAGIVTWKVVRRATPPGGT